MEYSDPEDEELTEQDVLKFLDKLLAFAEKYKSREWTETALRAWPIPFAAIGTLFTLKYLKEQESAGLFTPEWWGNWIENGLVGPILGSFLPIDDWIKDGLINPPSWWPDIPVLSG